MEKEIRLIDADKLKKHYAWWEDGSQEMTLDEAKKTFDTIIDVQPEAIIHCRDCDYYYPMGNDWCGYCSMIARGWTDAILPSDFCSRGVRRRDAEEK